MAIFNSYVKLPEVTAPVSFVYSNRTTQDLTIFLSSLHVGCPHEASPAAVAKDGKKVPAVLEMDRKCGNAHGRSWKLDAPWNIMCEGMEIMETHQKP